MARMNFVPELREKFKTQIGKQGINPRIVETALEQWDAGSEPSSPYIRACFEVFSKVQAEIDAGKEV